MNISTIIHQRGFASGKLTLEFSGKIIPEDALNTFPEFKAILNEIKERNWRYVYIQTNGKTVVEFDLSNQPCKIIPYGVWGGPGTFTVDIEMGRNMPDAKIVSVDEFRINVATKNLPRATTVDIARRTITYIDDNFWNWRDEWENDESKLTLALEVYEVVKWLVEDKEFKLHENYSPERYQDLKVKFEELTSRGLAVHKSDHGEKSK